MAAVTSTSTGVPDSLQALDHTQLIAFLQSAGCVMALQQVKRLRIDGFALAAVVDGLGFRTTTSGDFLLGQWLANQVGAYIDAVDECTILLGAVAKCRGGGGR